MANINDAGVRRPLPNRDSGADVWRSVLESRETGRNMPGAANRARRREMVRKDSVEPQNTNSGAMPYAAERNTGVMPYAEDRAPNMGAMPYAAGKEPNMGAMPYAGDKGNDTGMMPYEIGKDPNAGAVPFETDIPPNVGAIPYAAGKNPDMGAMPYAAEPDMYAMPYGADKNPGGAVPQTYFDREIDLLPRLFPDENLAGLPYAEFTAAPRLTGPDAGGEALMKEKEAEKDERIEKYILSELDDARFYRMLARKAPGKRSSETLNKLAAKERKHAKSLAAGLFIATGARADIREKQTRRITVSYRDALRDMYLHERDDAVAFMRMSIDSQDPVMSKLLAGIAREEEESAAILLDLLQAAM